MYFSFCWLVVDVDVVSGGVCGCCGGGLDGLTADEAALTLTLTLLFDVSPFTTGVGVDALDETFD